VLLERQTESTVLQLSTELEACRTRLATYSAWELEVDAAIVHAADGNDASLRSLMQATGQGGRTPFDLDRRVAQTIQLAQKLRLSEERALALEKQLVVVQAELVRAKHIAETAAEDRERINKPVSYLIAQLRSAEDMGEASAKESERLQGNYFMRFEARNIYYY
jgi:hypothetical protein